MALTQKAFNLTSCGLIIFYALGVQSLFGSKEFPVNANNHLWTCDDNDFGQVIIKGIGENELTIELGLFGLFFSFTGDPRQEENNLSLWPDSMALKAYSLPSNTIFYPSNFNLNLNDIRVGNPNSLSTVLTVNYNDLVISQDLKCI